MEKNNNNLRNLSLLIIVVIILGGFMWASNLAKAQDEIFIKQSELYTEALTYYGEEEYEEVEKLLSQLLDYQPESMDILELATWTNRQLGQDEKALEYGKQLLEVNPHTVEDNEFLLLLCELFYQTNDLENAKYVFDRINTQLDDETYENNEDLIKFLSSELGKELNNATFK